MFNMQNNDNYKTLKKWNFIKVIIVQYFYFLDNPCSLFKFDHMYFQLIF